MALALATLEAPRSVSVLGATGSVGRSTLDLIARTPERYRVEALTAHRNVEGLAAAALRHGARFAVIGEPAGYRRLKDLLAGSDIEVAAGADALIEAAARPAEWVMAAIVGAAGLRPTLTAVRRAALVALATKECLVCAGALLMAEVVRSGAVLLPVDSEHNAIFQALRGARRVARASAMAGSRGRRPARAAPAQGLRTRGRRPGPTGRRGRGSGCRCP